MKCPYCGVENADTAQRCPCGYAFASDDLHPGMPVNEALLQTVFSYWRGSPEDFTRLEGLLSDPLTPDHARLLLEWDQLASPRSVDSLVRWLECQPATWEEFDRSEAKRRREEAWRLAGGYFSWKALHRLRRLDPSLPWGQPGRHPSTYTPYRRSASPCPQCGTPPERLTWIRSRGGWVWRRWAWGWVIVCDPCHLQVAFVFDEK
jgi:hypothetical protein